MWELIFWQVSLSCVYLLGLLGFTAVKNITPAIAPMEILATTWVIFSSAYLLASAVAIHKSKNVALTVALLNNLTSVLATLVVGFFTAPLPFPLGTVPLILVVGAICLDMWRKIIARLTDYAQSAGTSKKMIFFLCAVQLIFLVGKSMEYFK